MSWVDNVLATPTIGIRIDTKFTAMTIFRDLFLSFFDNLNNKYGNIEIKQTGLWGYIISPKDKSGFHYAITPDNIVVNYNYFMTHRKLSGSFPILESPELQLYSKLLGLNLMEIEHLNTITQSIKDITYNKIGIVLNANLSKDISPPGLLTLINFLGKPWDHKIIKLELNRLLVKLNDSETQYDQCHHFIKLNESDPQEEFLFRLDWQRVYKKPLPFEARKLSENLTSCINGALEYFDKFGEGNLKYE